MSTRPRSRAPHEGETTEADRARREERRRASVPVIELPEELPITERADEIAAAIRDHQVVVVAGETGSGKSTQLPKICLAAGRGIAGAIGHTQPRRIAARAVAERVAEELGTEVGDLVGYTVRFTDRASDRTLVKVMTDGILLAELQSDPDLLRYDTIIIDEAHERSLTIDFLLGYLRRLLPRRPDLRVVVTSATIDTARIAEHFGGAPVIEVSGRAYPVDVRYRPLDEDTDQIQGIVDAVQELAREGPGDVLVFLSGEREIRDAADALARLDLPSTELLPLYARLSAAEQHRVFAPHAGRRIVLATNVAETSLTVPGIRFVVDPGTARISRYSRRLKVQRLPIEPVSQASANQRAGRCGRIGPGVAVRLYAEDDFESRPEFTDPEILRTNLASVILQMAALRLGDVASFPFVDPPEARSIADGIALLEELGALEPGTGAPGSEPRLTKLGRRLARLPVDPRLGRMVVEAERNDCLEDVLVIAAALSIQDPRERPVAARGTADEMHARFADPTSDFLSLVNLWRYIEDRQAEMTSSRFRRMCKAEHLSYLRVREWQDVHAQLRRAATGERDGRGRRERPKDREGPAEAAAGRRSAPRQDRADARARAARSAAVHRSVLAGLLSHVGMRVGDTRDYQGARGARFAIGPGSALAAKPPRWVVAAELVETTRLWARTVAAIDPAWIEPLAGHLVKRSHGEPRWDERRGGAVVEERVTLYGLPIASRRIGLGRIDREAARWLFLHRALVEGDWETGNEVLLANRALADELRALEDRARRRDILVDDDVIAALYDERIPAWVTSGQDFDRWWRDEGRHHPDRLALGKDDLVAKGASHVATDAFPDEWVQGDLRLPLAYEVAPGEEHDGVTVEVPIEVLGRVRSEGFDWQVPGYRQDLVVALIRSLPKPIRRLFVPAPEVAQAFLERAAPEDGRLLDVLTRELPRIAGEPLPPGSFDPSRIPAHLRVRFRVVGDGGEVLAEGDDLDALRRGLQGEVRAAAAGAAPTIERTGLVAWPDVALSRVVESERGGNVVRAYPALVDEGASVGVRLLPSEAEQHDSMWAGTRRLLSLRLPSAARAAEPAMTNTVKLAIAHLGHGTVADVVADCTTAALDHLMARHGAPVWDADAFERLVADVRGDLHGAVAAVAAPVAAALTSASLIDRALDDMTSPSLAGVVADARWQLDGLVHPGFATAAGAERLLDVARYLAGLAHRLERAPADPARDRRNVAVVRALEDELDAALERRPELQGDPAAAEVRWLIEELRMSLFAQQMGVAGKVSEKRVRQALASLGA